MALDLKVNAVFNPDTGEVMNIADYTGIYGADNTGGYNAPNIPATAVTVTRFIFGSYLQELNAEDSITIESGREYLVGGTGSFVYDTHTYTTGDTFISMLSGTPTLSSCTLTTTGRYSPVLGFLPTSATTSDITPSLVGEDTTIFVDTVRSVEYSVYTGTVTASVGIAAGTYIVFGTTGQTVTISGVTYRINEVFTQGSTFTMTGTGSIGLLNATTMDSGSISPKFFQTSYYAYQAIQELELRLAASNCGCTDKLQETVEEVNTLYAALLANFDQPLTLDISGSQNIMDRIVQLAANTCNC